MSDFVAQIRATLDTKQAQSDFNSFKSKIESEIINLKVKFDGTGNNSSFDTYLNNIQKQAQTAGKGIGTSLQQGIKSVKFNGNSETFIKQYLEQIKKDTKEAETVAKKFDASQKDALKAVNARNRAEIKANNEAIKEQKKQQQEQQKLNAQNLAQIRTAEESQKRIQVQQQIAAMKANAVQKNAHYNSLVQQGKDNIARLKQEYEDQSKYLQKYESYKTKLDNLKSTVSKDSSLLGSSGYDKITSQINQAEQAVQRFNTELQKGENANLNNLTSDLKEVNSLTQKATKEYQKLSTSASAIDQQNFLNQLRKYENENARAVKYGQSTWNNIMSSANSGQLTTGQLTDLKAQFKSFDLEMQAAGKTGKSFFQEIQRGFKKIGEFAYTYGVIQEVENALTSSINELKSIDTIITEISKASDAPVKQLKELGSNSFDIASKYGQKASDYLLGVQEMTRAGYSDTNGMAELSTLAQSAGDMTAELANQYLIASDMAFGYGGNVEKLNALLDSQNQINKMVC